ncbi:MAG TPA: hypothetical protein VF234_06820 [Limnochordia bacterium]
MHLVCFSPDQTARPAALRTGVIVHDWVLDLAALAGWWRAEFMPRGAPRGLVAGLPVPPEICRDLLTFLGAGTAASHGAALLVSHILRLAGPPVAGPDGQPFPHAPAPVRACVYRADAVRLHAPLPARTVDLTPFGRLSRRGPARVGIGLILGGPPAPLIGYCLIAARRPRRRPSIGLGPVLVTRDELPRPEELVVHVSSADDAITTRRPFSAESPWHIAERAAGSARGEIRIVPLPLSIEPDLWPQRLTAAGFGTLSIVPPDPSLFGTRKRMRALGAPAWWRHLGERLRSFWAGRNRRRK